MTAELKKLFVYCFAAFITPTNPVFSYFSFISKAISQNYAVFQLFSGIPDGGQEATVALAPPLSTQKIRFNYFLSVF